MHLNLCLIVRFVEVLSDFLKYLILVLKGLGSEVLVFGVISLLRVRSFRMCCILTLCGPVSST